MPPAPLPWEAGRRMNGKAGLGAQEGSGDGTLLSRLQADSQALTPFHMPGHKRNTRLASYLAELRADLDFTETEGLDCLNAPEGLLRDAMQQAAGLYQAGHSFYLVNGSTGGILAGIRALSRPGDTVLVARNCHISVFHALSLLSLQPVYLLPEAEAEFGITCSVSVPCVKEAILKNPDARMLILTSPSYEGVISDLAEICRTARDAGLPVFVDEAHGAHLDLSPYFTGGAVRAGADIVVHSLHKTLPSLTQTALMHVRDRDQARRVAQELGVFQTSSPSWLLLASIDGCVRLLSKGSGELFARWDQALTAFDAKAFSLEYLRVPGHTISLSEDSGVFSLDRGKILISCAGTDLTGPELAQRLRQEGRIETEMAQEGYVLAMTGLGDTRQSLVRLADALQQIDRGLHRKDSGVPSAAPVKTKLALPISDARDLSWTILSTDRVVGRVCAELVTLYPPGIPLIAPGEIITREAVRRLQAATSAGIAGSLSGPGWEQIAVLA